MNNFLKKLLEKLTKREIILIAVIIVLIAAIVTIIVINKPKKISTQPATAESLPSVINFTSSANKPSATWQPLTTKIIVPDTNSPESGFATPNVVVAAAPYASAKARSFSITISANQFSPAKIAVNQGDNVSISFTAKDQNYDVAIPDYGLHQIIPKGSSKPIMFQATATGQFTFYCPSCGGPAKGPVGYLFVAPK